ncbi:TPA: hypothetical protein ACGO9B_001943 [Streptococcus suis]
MKPAYRIILALLLGLFTLYLAMAVFPISTIIGPILVTITLFSAIYTILVIYKWKPKWGEMLLELVLNFQTSSTGLVFLFPIIVIL